MKVVKFAAAIAALALAATAFAACGGNSGSSAVSDTQKWADSVCTAGSGLKTAAADLADAVKSPSISDIAGYKAKVAQKYSALETAVAAVDQQWSAASTINNDTTGAMQTLRKDEQALYTAWALVQTASTKVSKATSIGGAIGATTELAGAMTQTVAAASLLVQGYKDFTSSKNDQLKQAFSNASSCKALFGKK
jgi:hypothetical protein